MLEKGEINTLKALITKSVVDFENTIENESPRFTQSELDGFKEYVSYLEEIHLKLDHFKIN